jgi:uncharacterized membrane protein
MGSRVRTTEPRKDETVNEAGRARGLVQVAEPSAARFWRGDRGKGGMESVQGVGKGRRMPVQQAVDVAVPVETAYNQWTQFEEWPNFMQRVTRVTQEDDCTISVATKMWGVSREFQADIETQRPEERIQWSVSQGITHHGVVTFHELAPRLTRIELNVDVDPGSLLEKAARGMRHIKRAMRADLHRFKAFIEMQETETGAWRGVIEEGELVEEHPDDYDQGREYSDVEEGFAEEPDEDEESEDEEQDQRSRSGRKRQAERSSRSGSSSRRSRARSSSQDGSSGSATRRSKRSSSPSRNRSEGRHRKASSRS